MMNLGDVPAGSTLYVPFATYNAAGASVTITGLAVTDIEIYKNGSVTQRSSDAGYALLDTDGIDFDGITGIHGFSIDLSDNTDAGFYAAGAAYFLVVSAITVDSQTVNFVYYFTIDRANVLRPTTAGRTLDVTSTGEAGLDFANVALPDGPIPALGILEGGTAQSATGTTLVGRAAATDGIVQAGNVLGAFGSTQGYWQFVMIDSVSTDTFTIAAWPVATPSGTITYRVWGTPRVSTNLPIPADLRQMGGDAQSATDLKDFADAGYDPSTNKVQGVVLTDTATALTNAVTLADGAHGGSAATITAKSIAVTNSDAGGVAVNLVGSGTGNSHALRLQSTNGHGMAIGSTNGNAINAASTSADAVSIAGGTNSDGIQVAGNGTGVDIRANITGNITGTLSELTTAVADSIPADGSRPSPAQALYILTQFLLERSVSGTTLTVNKPDGTTALMTLTLSDATSPTSITRAT